MNFFLPRDPAAKCNIVGVQRAPVAAGAAISFAWDDACFAGKWTDKFVAKQYADLIAATAATDAKKLRLRQLNPWLKDTLLFLSTNNLKTLYVFKSCDGGNTWTNTITCTSAPATGGALKDLGFLPYATFNTDDPGGIPSHITDLNVQGGLSYTYNLLGVTRGAIFQLLNGDSTTVNPAGDTVCAKNCRAEIDTLTPVIFNGLTGSTSNRNVARVYLAVSRQGGGAQASVTATASAGAMPASRVGFATVSDSLTPATDTVSVGHSSHATSGATTTPRALRDNPDYPRCDMAVDASLGVDGSKRFDQEFFLRDSAATVAVPLLATPTVTWRANLATQNYATTASQANGDYQITWVDKPFGPGELFRLNFNDRQGSVNAIVASLNARQTASTGAVDTTTPRALTQAGGLVDTSQLVAVK